MTKHRLVLFQIILLLAVLWLGYTLVAQVNDNLARQNIATGFDFLQQEAGFGISQAPIDYSPAHNYGRAILVGCANTLLVAIPGILLAIILGTLIGISRLSSNWLLRMLAGCYVDAFRNVPVLLQLFFWYALFTELLPQAKDALQPFQYFFISNKGLVMPALQLPEFVWDLPQRTRFGFRGGLQLSPEYIAVLAGLTLYTAAFIAEIVRAGILSVNKGQTEAALSLGLSNAATLKLVVLPQALRVIIPPLTSQMLNLTKNSSLAVAIGYPELVSITQTTMNQTGQAIEAITIMMAIYLTLSLLTSLFMNWYNGKVNKLTS